MFESGIPAEHYALWQASGGLQNTVPDILLSGVPPLQSTISGGIWDAPRRHPRHQDCHQLQNRLRSTVERWVPTTSSGTVPSSPNGAEPCLLLLPVGLRPSSSAAFPSSGRQWRPLLRLQNCRAIPLRRVSGTARHGIVSTLETQPQELHDQIEQEAPLPSTANASTGSR
jgi:hypothetical protein